MPGQKQPKPRLRVDLTVTKGLESAIHEKCRALNVDLKDGVKFALAEWSARPAVYYWPEVPSQAGMVGSVMEVVS